MSRPTCVGAIVSKTKILTSAACVDFKKKLTVVVGATGWNEGGQTHTLKHRIHQHGIAVLELNEPLVFNDDIKAIEIAKEKPKANTDLLSAGWCANKGEPVLREVAMTYMPETPCPNGSICNKVVKGQTCASDVGSGLWTPLNHGKAGTPAKLVGILSPEGAEADMPHFVDITTKEAREFLKNEKFIKTGWF